MSVSRRTFLTGTTAGLSVLALSACAETGPAPLPGSPSPTVAPTPALPAPTAILRSGWGSNPLFRGSHSFLPVGASPELRTVLAQPLARRVYFAGEATSAADPSTVQGALTSGLRAAAEIAADGAGNERILVLGSGIAGAAAAGRLRAAGHRVTVLEAGVRTGGRIATVPDPAWPVPVELGALELRDTDGGLPQQLTDLGVRMSRPGLTERIVTETGSDVTPTDLTASNRDADAAVANAVAWAARRPADLPLADALRGAGSDGFDAAGIGQTLTPLSYLALRLRSQFGLRLGGQADGISAWYGPNELGTGRQSLVLGGYGRLVESLLTGVDVALSSPAGSVSYGNTGVSVRLVSGESLTADRVVVAVPLGVLKDAGIGFDPLLPFPKRAAIAALGVGTVETVALRFAIPFWSGGAVLWKQLGSASPFTEWINLEPLTGAAVLLGRVGPDGANTVAKLSEPELSALARNALVPFAAVVPK